MSDFFLIKDFWSSCKNDRALLYVKAKEIVLIRRNCPFNDQSLDTERWLRPKSIQNILKHDGCQLHAGLRYSLTSVINVIDSPENKNDSWNMQVTWNAYCKYSKINCFVQGLAWFVISIRLAYEFSYDNWNWTYIHTYMHIYAHLLVYSFIYKYVFAMKNQRFQNRIMFV